MFTCISHLLNILHAVTFSHVLHLDVIRRQKLKVKTDTYGYNAEQPIAIPITQYGSTK